MFFPNIDAIIEQSTRELESKQQTTPAVSDIEQRAVYLEQLKVDWLRASRLLDPAIFVSFSGEEAEALHRQAMTIVRATKAIPVGPHFRTESGMKQEGAPGVADHVLYRMNPCYGFLGIVTAEMKLTSGAGVPGPWVQIEAGMAMAFRLRCVLMVEKGVHQDFWRKPFGHLRFVAFDRSMFKARVTRAMTIFQEHYRTDAAAARR
jgi:hypothetical protein